MPLAKIFFAKHLVDSPPGIPVADNSPIKEKKGRVATVCPW